MAFMTVCRPVLHCLAAVGLLQAATIAGVPPNVPQTHETGQQRDQRMQWFRDAKFGMFVHWGPCAVGPREIGWGRNATRPHDISEKTHGPRGSDPEYDNYYKQFNPVKFNAPEWVRFARESGMKYIVIIAKHHDGFSMFDSAVTDYDIMATPYRKDIIGALADACHAQGMKFGIYYSTRDWYHEDYLVGDNTKYDAWYRAQVRELLNHYGKVDVMWFDHVGGQDWSKWNFTSLFEMMYDAQPGLIVNNRAAKFCGFERPRDRNVPSEEIRAMAAGDYTTPEGTIGAMNIERDWESCIHVGKGWSYRGEDGFKGPDDCIKMLVSCTTGGGNLLLNFGPRPDGSFADGEARVAVAMGKWLEKYGEAIYGTRAGPYRNGGWGGSCHRENKLYLHLYEVPKLGMTLDPIANKVLSARTLDGGAVEFSQNDTELVIKVAEEHRDHPVTVVELTMEQALVSGRIIGGSKLPENVEKAKGELISQQAVVTATSPIDEKNRAALAEFFSPAASGEPTLQTRPAPQTWATVDLGSARTATVIEIDNAPGRRATRTLGVSVSLDGKDWEEIFLSGGPQPTFRIPVTRFHSGIDVPGREIRYIKLTGISPHSPRPLHLTRMRVYGE
jgi:alpha-L-fucosidase